MSSLTPGKKENSWFIPAIRTAVIAVPFKSANKTRRRVLPIVTPKPSLTELKLKRPK